MSKTHFQSKSPISKGSPSHGAWRSRVEELCQPLRGVRVPADFSQRLPEQVLPAGARLNRDFITQSTLALANSRPFLISWASRSVSTDWLNIAAGHQAVLFRPANGGPSIHRTL